MNTADTSQPTPPAQPPADSSQNGSPLVTATAPPATPATAADGVTLPPTQVNPPDNGAVNNGGAGVATDPTTGRPRINRADYEKMLMRKPSAPPEANAPVAQAPAQQPPAAPVAPTTAQPPAAPVVPPATPADDVGKLRYQPKGDDAKVQASVIDIAKNSGRSILDPEVIAAARALHGLPASPAPAAVPTTAPVTPTTPVAQPPSQPVVTPTTTSDLAAIDTELQTHEAAYVSARENFDSKAELDAIKAMQDAHDRRAELMRMQRDAEQRSMSEAQRSITAEWNDHTTKAVAKFPDAAKADSALSIKAAELQKAAQLRGDPVANSVFSGKFFIELAAEELGVAPVTAAPAAPTSVATPAPPTVRPPMSSLIAGGSSQQTTRPVADSNAPRIMSKADYDAMMTRTRGIQYGGAPQRAAV